jgi:hypothetical protein
LEKNSSVLPRDLYVDPEMYQMKYFLTHKNYFLPHQDQRYGVFYLLPHKNYFLPHQDQ